MRMKRFRIAVGCWGVVGLSAVLTLTMVSSCKPASQSLVDDGGGRKPEDFPEIAEDVFRELDGGIKDLTPAQMAESARAASIKWGRIIRELNLRND